MGNCVILLEKPLLTITNLAFIPAFCLFVRSGEYIQAGSLLFAALASMFYHGTEPKRYTPHISNLFDFNPRLKLDQIGALSCMIVLANKQMIKEYYAQIIILLILMIASDLVYWTNFTNATKVLIRLITHCPWHIGTLGYLAYIRASNPKYQF